jgi:hypothetical protein
MAPPTNSRYKLVTGAISSLVERAACCSPDELCEYIKRFNNSSSTHVIYTDYRGNFTIRAKS